MLAAAAPKRSLLHLLHSGCCVTTRPFTAFPLLVDQQPTPLLQTLCFSLADNLINQGFIASAQDVIDRMLKKSSSLPDIISTIHFVDLRGLNLNSDSYYSFLIQKLVDSNQTHLACTILKKGIVPIPSILNSMILCYCELGDLSEAINLLEQLAGFDPLCCKIGYNALLRWLCTQEIVPDAFRLFNRMAESGVFPGISCYTLLIDELCFRGDLDAALHVFKKLNVAGSQPSVYLYRSLVYSFCMRQRVLEAECLCREMETYGLTPDRRMYTSLIKGYCKEGAMKLAMCVFLRMLKLVCRPDAYTYNTLIYGFCESGCIDSGWKLYDWMCDSGLQPNLVTFTILINVYCKDDKADYGLKLLEIMFRSNLTPTVQFYTVVISSLFREKRLDEAYELFSKMLESDVAPDHVIFLSILKMLPMGNAVHLAIDILQAVAKRGRHIDPYLFSDPVNPPSSEEPEEIIELLFNKLLESSTYFATDILLVALCADGIANLALRCMKKMISHGCEPSLSTFNSMIKCLCKHGDLASTFEVLKEMDKMGLEPNVVIYDTIIGALCSEKRLGEAEYMFKKMLESGVAADEIVYTTLINGYSKIGKAVDACRIFDQMIESGIQPSSHAYSALINGLIKINMTEKGYCYLRRMLKDGFEPDTVLYTILINQFCRKGDVSFAYLLADLMDRHQISRNLITSGSLISGVCRNISHRARTYRFLDERSQQTKDMLLQLLLGSQRKPKNRRVFWKSSEDMINIAIEEMQTVEIMGLKPDLHLHSAIINGYCVAGKMGDAYEYFELMLEGGLCPNKVTYTTLLNGYVRIGEIDSAIQLFNRMNTNGCVPDVITYNTLIKGLCLTERVIDALSLMCTMNKRGLFPSKVSYERLVTCLCKLCSSGGDKFSVDAFKLCEEMLLHGYVPSRFSYNWLLCILCEQNKLHESHRLIDMMLKRGKTPKDEIKRQVVEACYKQREFDLAFMLEENIVVYEDR